MPALCPDDHALQALLWDDGPDVPAGWQQHLETCPRCQQTLERLAADGDSWADVACQLGPAGPDTPPPACLTAARDAALERVMLRLKQDEPPGPNPDAGPAAEELDLSFLRPADRPDLLGYLGDYEVSAVLGRGGMGVVFAALDPVLRRQVAVKVLAPWLAGSSTARQRFLREGRSAAAVSHDHVVPIYEVAEAGGLPYLVMQHVAGMSLEERLAGGDPLPLREVVRIGMETASGLAAAHARGLVHRDVKPANVLLEAGTGRVRLTDFGLARPVQDASLTASGTISGTPLYMAPEQARGEPVDARADLFSLGSVLYALCTGRPPFGTGPFLAVLRRVSDAEPPPVRAVNPEVPGWLEEVITRLHAKDPGRRFASAAEVAELLRQHLAHPDQPAAVPPPRRLVGRRPGRPWRRLLVAAALLAAAALGLGEAAGLTHFLPSAGPPAGKGREGPAAAGPARPAPQGAAGRKGAPVVLRTSRVLWEAHNEAVAAGAFLANGKQLVSAGWDGTIRVWDVPAGKLRVNIPGLARGCRALAVSPDGKTIASAAQDNAVRLWDAATGEPRAVLRGHVGRILGLAFSPDGQTLASAGGAFGRAGELKLWDPATGKERLLVRPFAKELWGVAYAPDGKRLAVAVGDGTAQVVDGASGKVLATFKHPAYARRVAFSPDGKQLAVSYGEVGFVTLWDLQAREMRSSFEAHPRSLFNLAYSPDGRQLLTAGVNGIATVWDVTRPQVRAVMTILCQQGQAWFAAFSPDGRLIATGGSDHTIRLWDLGQD